MIFIILIKDLELFEDVLDLAGQNQSVGQEILRKLQETKEKEEEEERKRKEEEALRLSGTPHLVNLNEDPMLDRKVVYDIKEG